MQSKTDEEIRELELWARKKRNCKYGFKSSSERRIVEHIEALSLCEWEGVRKCESSSMNELDTVTCSLEEPNTRYKFTLKGNVVNDEDYKVFSEFNTMAISPTVVKQEIERAKGKPLDITITSPGGNYLAGIEICEMLNNYKENTAIKAIGLVGSAASLIAISGDKLLMKSNASLFIHRSRLGTQDSLEESDIQMADMYAAKSGLEQEVFLKLMDKETFLSADQAMNYKLIDGIVFDNYLIETQ